MNASTVTAPTFPAGPLTERSLPSEATLPDVIVPPTPLRPPSLRRNISWTLLGNVVYAASQWGIVIAIARMGTIEMVGQFALAVAITTPIYMFTNLQLRQLFVVDSKPEFQLRQYATIRIVSITLAVLVSTVAAFFATADRQTLTIVLGMALVKAPESLGELLYGVQQRKESMQVVSISLIIRALLSLGFAGLGMWLTGNLLAVIAGLFLSRVAVLIAYDLPRALPSHGLRGLFHINGNSPIAQSLCACSLGSLLPLVSKGAALGAASFLLSMVSQAPRFAIVAFLDQRQLGIFAALAWLTVAGHMFVVALGQSASPRLARFHSTHDSVRFRHLLITLLLLVWGLWAVGAIAAVLFGKHLLTMCYGEEYASHHSFFTAMIAVSALISSIEVIGVAVTSKSCLYLQSPVALLSLAVTFAACWGLVPVYGLWGALAGHACGWIVLGTGYVWLLNSRPMMVGEPLWRT